MTEYRIETVGIDDFDVEPGSVDLILTDPPYPREFLWTWRALAEFAERVLKPGGSLLAMSGQMFLPQIMSDFADFDLDFVWMIGYVMSGPNSRLWQERLYGTWKPILWYAKGKPPTAPRRMTRDSVIASGRDKRFHHWGQDVGTFDHLTRNFSRRGDLVCDPFLGGGTTALAVLVNGRRFVGCDVDPKAIALTETRIAALEDYRRARLTQPDLTDTPGGDVGNTTDEPEEVDDGYEDDQRPRGGDRGPSRDGRTRPDQGRDARGGEASGTRRPDSARDGRLDDLQPREERRDVPDPGEGDRRTHGRGSGAGSGAGRGAESGRDAGVGSREGREREGGGEAGPEAEAEVGGEEVAEAEGRNDRLEATETDDGDRASARSSSVVGGQE